MLPWTAAVLIGVIVALFWPAFPLSAATVAAATVAVSVRVRAARRPALMALAAAFWASLVAAHVLSSRVISPQAGVVRGCVTSGVWLEGGRVRFAFAAHRFNDRAVRWQLRLAGYDGVRVPRPGECWQLPVRLKPPRGLLNPLGPDAERRAFVQRWSGRGIAVLDQRASRLGELASAPLLKRRLAIANRLRFVLGEGDAWPLLVALAVGLREPLPGDVNDLLTATGTRHLVSISGLHIGLVAAMGWWLAAHSVAPLARWWCRGAWQRCRGDLLAGPGGALVAAAAYAALAGFALPTRRALIMLAVWLAGVVLGRRVALADTLGAAAVLILALDPLSVLDPGFWLSFVAVAALGALGLRERAGPLRAQWIAFAGLLPVVAIGLGRLSLVGPLANAVWVPLFSVLVVPGVLLGLVVLAGPVAPAVAYFSGLTSVVQSALAWLAPLGAWPGAQVRLPSAPVWATLLALPGVVGLLMPKVRWRWRVLAFALCLPLAGARGERPDHGQVRVQVFDVAHGLAVAVHTRRHTVLYDAGGRWSDTDAGERVVVPELSRLGVTRLHTLVVSHGDLDHRGGANTVLAALPAEQVLSGEPLRTGGQPCRAGQSWRLDGVRFEIIHPRAAHRWRGNNASCVLRVRARHGSLLLTGDLERLGEASLLHRGALARTTVVVGQHHGSKTSSGAGFVAATEPVLAIFSTAYANRWSLPAESVTRRWASVGAMTCATSDIGAITLSLDGRPLAASLGAARASRPALWRWTPELATRGWQSAFRVRTGRDILRASC